ncbi:MAG: hypothetical protein JNL74_06475, partial [Fibrobacteres bacterium]|nr:hypothetical protein [Fibrobacterota bacterium]
MKNATSCGERKKRMVALWFVHDLISLNNKTDLAMLFYVQEADMNEGIDSIVETSFAELPKGQDKIVGTFVKRERNGLVPANSFPIAKRAFFLSNLYRGRLIKRYGETQTSKNCQIKAEYSYHVNVGHGNCSILVVKNNNQYQLWMVDCSNHDYLNKQFYTSNIEKSIMHIMSTFK